MKLESGQSDASLPPGHLSEKPLIGQIHPLSHGHDGKMDKSRLRRHAGIKLADLEPIHGELAREGRIRITGEVISLI
jgi:hypothetical protein